MDVTLDLRIYDYKRAVLVPLVLSSTLMRPPRQPCPAHPPTPPASAASSMAPKTLLMGQGSSLMALQRLPHPRFALRLVRFPLVPVPPGPLQGLLRGPPTLRLPPQQRPCATRFASAVFAVFDLAQLLRVGWHCLHCCSRAGA